MEGSPTLASMHIHVQHGRRKKTHEQCASEWQWYWHVRGPSFVKKKKHLSIRHCTKHTKSRKAFSMLLRMCSCALADCSVAILSPRESFSNAYNSNPSYKDPSRPALLNSLFDWLVRVARCKWAKQGTFGRSKSNSFYEIQPARNRYHLKLSI